MKSSESENEKRLRILEKAQEDAYHREFDLDKRDADYEDAKSKMRGHNWRQQGRMLYCTSCPSSHGFYPDPKHWVFQLQGTDDNGNPIIKKIQ